jgi:hypothetical protein
MKGSESTAQTGGRVELGYPLVVGAGLVPLGGAAWKASRTASGSRRTGCSGSEVAVAETTSAQPATPVGSSPSTA